MDCVTKDVILDGREITVYNVPALCLCLSLSLSLSPLVKLSDCSFVCIYFFLSLPLSFLSSELSESSCLNGNNDETHVCFAQHAFMAFMGNVVNNSAMLHAQAAITRMVSVTMDVNLAGRERFVSKVDKMLSFFHFFSLSDSMSLYFHSSCLLSLPISSYFPSPPFSFLFFLCLFFLSPSLSFCFPFS